MRELLGASLAAIRVFNKLTLKRGMKQVTASPTMMPKMI